MQVASFLAIIRALNEAQVRYLVVGGLAVAAYGYMRFTKDVDLVIELEPANLERALLALSQLGYRPKVPVPVTAFADPVQRESWIRDKHMIVFQLFSDAHIRTPIDIFVKEPFDFAPAYADAFGYEAAPGIIAPIVPLGILYDLKRTANRPEDLIDIEHLESIHNPGL